MNRLGVFAGKLVRAVVGLVLLVLGCAGFFALPASFVSYPVVAPPEGAPPRWVRGAFHVHTTRSDGRGTPLEVARAAKAAGLDFVLLTDHNDFTPPAPTWAEGVLLVPGVEMSTSAGHLVAFGMERPLQDVSKWMPPGEAVRAVKAAGGMSVLAHPVQRHNPWTDAQSASEALGFELYSADTFFRQAMSRPVSRLLPAVGAYLSQPVHGVMLLVAPEPGPSDHFMGLSQQFLRVPFCAHDAHGVPSYESVFQSMATYLPPDEVPFPLPEDAKAAAALVTKALAGGNGLCGFRALGEPAGFALEGLRPGLREARVGDVLSVRLPGSPEPETVRLEVWGAGRLRPDGLSVELTGEGVARVEVWAKGPGRFLGSEWRPWIVPGPVRVLPRGPGI
ncbi:CehA/McbA family metallohydrolase [Myxococcus sp. K15C18031901]|uniref:PHP domain-containing protein n=1 Tax=Myxococcus dinghuensis TaxID=2906761 RepID=UPI0020A70DD9|nr:CehA/McbA family metallohydrolase [Myxococcus dinghuensis]MCP3101394.1 CehA/McbA family metallohydrolase [Myxococcus dinghuensis]